MKNTEMGWIKAKYHSGHNWHFEPLECLTLQFCSYSFKEYCFHDCIQAWSVGSVQPMHPIYPLINTHTLYRVREWISNQKKFLHHLLQHLNNSGINQDKSGWKQQGVVANFALPVGAGGCGSLLFLVPLTLNSASEAFQEEKLPMNHKLATTVSFNLSVYTGRLHPPCVPNSLVLPF